jgi:hypothetical protein
VSSIIARLDAAIAQAEKHMPIEIRLTDSDRVKFDKEKSAEWGGPVHCFLHRAVQIYRGNASGVLCRDGRWFDLPSEAR